MRTFTKIIVLAVVTFALSHFMTGYASADMGERLTVRVTDEAAVEQELGQCQAGRQIIVVANGRTHRSGHGVREITVSPLRPTLAMSVNLECDGEIERLPSRGVSIELH